MRSIKSPTTVLYFTHIIVFCCLTGIDLASKYWALYQLQSSWVITSWLQFTFSLNCGIAFGLLSSCTLLGQMMLGCMAIGICIYLIQYHTQSMSQKIATTFIISGAMGNVISRALYQGVIDFIGLHYQNLYWPTFNLADTWICIGICLLILSSPTPNKTRI